MPAIPEPLSLLLDCPSSSSWERIMDALDEHLECGLELPSSIRARLDLWPDALRAAPAYLVEDERWPLLELARTLCIQGTGEQLRDSELKIIGDTIDQEQLAQLARAPEAARTSINTLVLTWNYGNALPEIARLGPLLPGLRRLILRAQTDRPLEPPPGYLVELLQRAPQLEELYLRNVAFGSRQDLGGVLAKAPDSLRHLEISACDRSTDESLNALCDQLEQGAMPALDSLALCHVRGVDLDAHLQAFARLWESTWLQRLRWLELRSFELNDQVAFHLAECAQLTQLQHLELARNPLGSRGLDAIVHSEHLGELKYLGIDDCRCDARDVFQALHSPMAERLQDLGIAPHWRYHDASLLEAATHEAFHPQLRARLVLLGSEELADLFAAPAGALERLQDLLRDKQPQEAWGQAARVHAKSSLSELSELLLPQGVLRQLLSSMEQLASADPVATVASCARVLCVSAEEVAKDVASSGPSLFLEAQDRAPADSTGGLSLDDAQLAYLLERVGPLELLELRGQSALTASGLEKALGRHKLSLRVVLLVDCPQLVSAEGCQQIAEIVGLRSLRIAGCDLDDAALAVLAKDATWDLESLLLEHNAITDAGVEELVEAPWMDTLEQLNLAGNQITMTGARLLREVYMELELELDLFGNPLPAQVIVELLEDLSPQEIRARGYDPERIEALWDQAEGSEDVWEEQE